MVSGVYFGWGDLQPRWAHLTVFAENAAVVTYYYEAKVEVGGKLVELTGRDMFFLIRGQGRWWAVADQLSGEPSEGTA